jgi:hypothetical protein
VAFDHEHHLTRADLASLRGSFVRRPSEYADPTEWERWAREIEEASSLARRILSALHTKREAHG